MFKFNFSGESGNENESMVSHSALKWSPASEVLPSTNHHEVINSGPETFTFHSSDLSVLHIQVEGTMSELIHDPELLHSDLIPAKYEGGFKVWECTQDLANYVLNTSNGINFKDSQVLDLGCGAGLLGICTFLRGASVHFQDYNEAVIQSLTIPNVLLNTEKDQREKKLSSCRFFSGDWESFVDFTNSTDLKYDFILTSETIYNSENYYKLCLVFKQKLKKTGSVFLAAKSYYFGVGGGLQQFEQFLKEDGTFQTTECWKCSQDVQREIIKITFADENVTRS